jgi:hypothetical protein
MWAEDREDDGGLWEERRLIRLVAHSTELCGGACHHVPKASRGEDLHIEEPVRGGYSPAFHCHPALTGMLDPTLIGYQVVQVREPRQQRLLTAVWMVAPFIANSFRPMG